MKTYMNKHTTKFNLALRIIHWTMAIAIIMLMIGGFYSTQLHNMPFSEYIPLFHRTVGTALLLLVCVRLIIRIITKAPRSHGQFSKQINIMAFLAQIGLYAAMILIPLTGFFIANSSDHGVLLYGMQLPELWVEASAVADFGKQAHYIFAYGGMLLIISHIAAVYYHRVMHNVDLLCGMTIDINGTVHAYFAAIKQHFIQHSHVIYSLSKSHK